MSQPAIRKYLDEALGLGVFMFSAGFFDMLIDRPALYLRRHLDSALLRRFLIGLSMGLTALFIFSSRFGKNSGAYINPAVTIVRYFLDDIGLKDGFFYILFQFAGGAAGMWLIYLLFPGLIAHPAINFIVTRPGSQGAVVAFLLEILISFILIATALFIGNSKRLKGYTPYFIAMLITLYITFEAPFSGMSMNPARSFASAIVAGEWDDFWIYCTAPVIGMLCGGALYAYYSRPQNSNQ